MDRKHSIRLSKNSPVVDPMREPVPLELGDTVPDFTLRWTFDRTVTLTDALQDGPVLLAFYVFDFGRY